MPTIQLTVRATGGPLPVQLPGGGTSTVEPVQFRCFVRAPNVPPLSAIIDTGAPFVYFPRRIWTRFREGIDFEWLPFAPGTVPPVNRIASWHFTFQFARFLVPLALVDYTTAIDRPDVIAAFASGDPAAPTQTGLPPVIIGLWGGLLEDGAIGVSRDPANGRVTGGLAVA